MSSTDLMVYKEGFSDFVLHDYSKQQCNPMKYPDTRDQRTYSKGWADAKNIMLKAYQKAQQKSTKCKTFILGEAQ